MKINIKINLALGIVRTKGTTRLHLYRNQYGVEAGFNVPRKFGVFAYIAKGAN